MYQTKYENPLNYSSESMDQSKNDLNKLFLLINNAYLNLFINQINVFDKNKKVNDNFINALANDLDLPNAIKIL